MGDNTPQENNVINLNEESRLYAEDPNGDFVAVGVDASGNLTVTIPTGSPLATDLQEVGGQAQSAVDIAAVLDALENALASVGTDTLQTEQQSPVGVEDTTGTQIDPVASGDASQVSATTAASGAANAASIDLGQVRNDVDVFYDVANDNGSIEVEVSTDNATWRPFTTVASGDIPTGGEQAFVQIDTAYRYVRAYAGGAYADADINTIEAVTRGI